MLLGHVIFRSPIFRLLHHAPVRIGDAARKADMHRETAREYVTTDVPGGFTRRLPARISRGEPDAWLPALPRRTASGATYGFHRGRSRANAAARRIRTTVGALHVWNGASGSGEVSDEPRPYDSRVTQGRTLELPGRWHRRCRASRRGCRSVSDEDCVQGATGHRAKATMRLTRSAVGGARAADRHAEGSC